MFSPSLAQAGCAIAKQMRASMRGVRAYLKFRQEYSFTCHRLLIYSLESPILFLWYQFLLTVALLTTSLNESLYNYDCWWPMTQTWRGCHYMNIKVIQRDAGMEDQGAAVLPPHLWCLHLKQGPILYSFITQANAIMSLPMDTLQHLIRQAWMRSSLGNDIVFSHNKCRHVVWFKTKGVS